MNDKEIIIQYPVPSQSVTDIILFAKHNRPKKIIVNLSIEPCQDCALGIDGVCVSANEAVS